MLKGPTNKIFPRSLINLKAPKSFSVGETDLRINFIDLITHTEKENYNSNDMALFF